MKVFVSYSHKDQEYLDRLKVHLSQLVKSGELSTWTDQEMLPGDPLDHVIARELSTCDMFIALVSPDYLNSFYCTEVEVTRALELSAERGVVIVPVIVEPCDWKHSAFSGLVALPKDGKPIGQWTNANLAFVNVVDGLRRLLKAKSSRPSAPQVRNRGGEPVRRRPSLKLKSDFTAVDRIRFLNASFGYLESFIQESINELNSLDQPAHGHFEALDLKAFTAIVSNKRKIKGDAFLTVRCASDQHSANIEVSHSQNVQRGHYNESYEVSNNEHEMFFENWSSFGNEKDKLDAAGLAERLWTNLLDRAGISFENDQGEGEG